MISCEATNEEGTHRNVLTSLVILQVTAVLWMLPYLNYVGRYIGPGYCQKAFESPQYYIWFFFQALLTLGVVISALRIARDPEHARRRAGLMGASLIPVLLAMSTIDDLWRLHTLGIAHRQMPLHMQHDVLSDMFFRWRSVWVLGLFCLTLTTLPWIVRLAKAELPRRVDYANMGISVLTILAGLIALEVCVRAGWMPEPWNVSEGGLDIYRFNTLLGWSHKCNAATEMRCRDFHISIRTNKMGLRDKEYEYEKTAGKCRVLCLGDSFTFGIGVEESRLYTEVLERLLGNRVDVLNAGVTGYGTLQEYLYLKEEGKRYTPDLVILGFYSQNDMIDNEQDRGMGFPRPHCEITERGLLIHSFAESDRYDYTSDFDPFTFRRWLRSVNYVARIWYGVTETGRLKKEPTKRTPSHLTRNQPDASRGQESEDWIEDNRFAQRPEGFMSTALLIQSLQEECRQIGAKLLVLLIPPEGILSPVSVKGSNGSFPDACSHRGAMDICRALNIQYVDCRASLSKLAARGANLYFENDAHWRPEAHKAAAELLLETIRARRLLPNECR